MVGSYDTAPPSCSKSYVILHIRVANFGGGQLAYEFHLSQAIVYREAFRDQSCGWAQAYGGYDFYHTHQYSLFPDISPED